MKWYSWLFAIFLVAADVLFVLGIIWTVWALFFKPDTHYPSSESILDVFAFLVGAASVMGFIGTTTALSTWGWKE